MWWCERDVKHDTDSLVYFHCSYSPRFKLGGRQTYGRDRQHDAADDIANSGKQNKTNQQNKGNPKQANK